MRALLFHLPNLLYAVITFGGFFLISEIGR